MCLGIDLMGSSLSPESIVAAAIDASVSNPSLSFHFFCTPDQKSLIPTGSAVTFSEEVVQPEDDPLSTLRRKKDATLYRGVDAVRDGVIQGFLSLGNTGAYVAKAATTLSPLFKDVKPALLAEIPSKLKMIAVLDVGATLTTSPEILVQLARLGSMYVKAAYVDRRLPKVALLNIGIESAKGTTELKLAYKLLEEHKDQLFDFVGNMEPNELFFSDVDVVVTSGFTGNIFLKTLEGAAALILDRLKENEGESTQFKNLRRSLYDLPSMSALIAGVDGLLIKCHGSSKEQDITRAIISAGQKMQSGFMQKRRTLQ